MKLNNFTICFVSIIILLINYLTSAQNCEFVLPDGMKYNFSNLKQQTDFSYTLAGYIYRANLCGPLVSACSINSQAPSAMFRQGINIYF